MAGRAGRPVESRSAFWDASALVPLCVNQPTTPKIFSLYRKYDAVVWWATPVEIASALSRLKRLNQLSSHDLAKARTLAADLAQEWLVVQPSEALRTSATRLLEQYELRAADALQLAAALAWCEGTPQDAMFLTADQKLREAAILAGFASERF
jgi:predicted nucleic acid-binding protein